MANLSRRRFLEILGATTMLGILRQVSPTLSLPPGAVNNSEQPVSTRMLLLGAPPGWNADQCCDLAVDFEEHLRACGLYYSVRVLPHGVTILGEIGTTHDFMRELFPARDMVLTGVTPA